jgi:hypothetical protein
MLNDLMYEYNFYSSIEIGYQSKSQFYFFRFAVWILLYIIYICSVKSILLEELLPYVGIHYDIIISNYSPKAK